MTERGRLHKNRLASFKCWLKSEGWSEEPAKGDYEVLRMTKAGRATLLIYTRLDAPQHLSIWGESQREFERWSRSM